MHPFILSAHRTLDIESRALQHIKTAINSSFVDVVELFCNCKGRVIVMGMGKSGHIGRKIAATLASTGTPAFFVHPAEASHGDLGMVAAQDIVLAISNSGEAPELTVVLPHLRRLKTPIIAMTGNLESTLARHADYTLSTFVEQEACPLNLAPTASTAVQLALGDALAIACLECKGFSVADFASTHPGGALGRKLLTRVCDLMRTGHTVPVVAAGSSFLAMMETMSLCGLGLAVLLDDEGHPIGIFTDGDLRRELSKGVNVLNAPISEVMRPHPKVIDDQSLAVDAASLMETHRITAILAVNKKHVLTGVINTNDLLRAKVI